MLGRLHGVSSSHRSKDVAHLNTRLMRNTFWVDGQRPIFVLRLYNFSDLFSKRPASEPPLNTTTNRLPIPSLPPEHPRRRARVAAHILRRDANVLAAARVDGADLIAAAVRAGRASRSATLCARQNARALAFGRCHAQAVGGAAGHVLAALRSSACEDLRDRRSDTCTCFAGLAGAASVAAGAAVGGVGLQVFAGVWRGATERGG
jgi:hypothetical protein